MILRRLRRLFRPLSLFDPDKAVHRDGWSIHEQLLGHRRSDDTAPDLYAPHPQWSPEAIAAAQRDIDRRVLAGKRRLARDVKVAGVRPIRRRA